MSALSRSLVDGTNNTVVELAFNENVVLTGVTLAHPDGTTHTGLAGATGRMHQLTVPPTPATRQTSARRRENSCYKHQECRSPPCS